MVGITGRGASAKGASAPAAARSISIRLGICLAALLASLAGAPAAARSATPVAPADRQATFGYLQARYDYLRAVLAHAGAVVAATRTVPTALQATCPGVLAHAPKEAPLFPASTRSPRAEGEAERRQFQRDTILGELSRTVIGAERAALAPFAARFDAAVERLRWSDPRVAAAVAAQRTLLPAVGVQEACADMSAWAQSGFRRLPASARESEKRSRASLESLRSQPSLETLLSRYEGPAERRLERRTATLGQSLGEGQLKGVAGVFELLQRAVGLPVPKPTHRPPSFVQLGHGVTHSGLEFSVSEQIRGGHAGRGCRREVSVAYTLRSTSGGSIVLIGGGGSGICIAGGAVSPAPRLECEEGSLAITAVVAAGVRRVRLELAGGRSISSKVVAIPARRGGPAGLYVQALGRHAARPTELVELGAHARAIATETVPRHAHCPSAYAEEPHSFALVHGRTPTGDPFTIEASVPPETFGDGGLELELEGGVQQRRSTAFSRPRREPFAVSLGDECPPDAWTIVYGVLKRPGASVTAVTPAGEVPLTLVPIRGPLHPGGELAYGVFAQFPTKLIVRDTAGDVIATDDLGAKATAAREFCEGYAEP